MKKNFTPFMLEREMGTWEHQVEYNLSESGVPPMSIRELLRGVRCTCRGLANLTWSW